MLKFGILSTLFPNRTVVVYLLDAELRDIPVREAGSNSGDLGLSAESSDNFALFIPPFFHTSAVPWGLSEAN